MRLTAASAAGKPCGQTTLALDHSTKDRAREIDMPTVHATSPPDIAAAELANFLLARVLGNEESALDCIQQDLWPRVLPKLQGAEEKASFGSAMPQTQTPPAHYALMLDLIQPPLDYTDTLVESRCATGSLVVQTRLATSVGKVVGVDVTKSRHKVASEARSRIADCGNASSDLGPEEGCPASLSALAGGDREYLRALSDGMEFALSSEPAVVSTSWPGATVLLALSQGWPSIERWRLSNHAAKSMPVGAIVISTSTWPGCRRGLMESSHVDLSSIPIGRRMRFAGALSTSAFLFAASGSFESSFYNRRGHRADGPRHDSHTRGRQRRCSDSSTRSNGNMARPYHHVRRS